MNAFTLTMRILSYILMAYFFLILARVLLSWVPGGSEGTQRIKKFISRLTDPYMSRFQNISWLRFGMLDFSPILGLGLLTFTLYIVQILAAGSIPTPGLIIALILDILWSVVAFFLLLLAIVMIVRLVSLYIYKDRRPAWTDRVDAFLFPKVSRILGLFTSKPVAYPVALGIGAALFLLIRFGVQFALQSYLFPFLGRF
ncbi:MAG: YggT family protein [Spirochaetales bacterium]|nr:YggT family protein [Spirochaetales bacterium]